MVVFVCNGCGDTVKKQQVDKHKMQCRKSHSIDCIDCSTTFEGNAFRAHTSCVSEAQKYGGKGFVAKVNKGQAKQESWIERVNGVVRTLKAKHPRMGDIVKYENIPRKQKPFVNFCVNSLNCGAPAAEELWAAIEKATESSQPQPQPVLPAKTDAATPQANGHGEKAVKKESVNGASKRKHDQDEDKPKKAKKIKQDIKEEDIKPITKESKKNKKAKKENKPKDDEDAVIGVDESLDQSTHELSASVANQEAADVNWGKELLRKVKLAPGQKIPKKSLFKAMRGLVKASCDDKNDTEQKRQKGALMDLALKKLVSKGKLTLDGKIVKIADN